MRSRSLYDTHPKVVINRANVDVCTPSSFRGARAQVPTYVRRYVRIDRTLLRSIDANHCYSLNHLDLVTSDTEFRNSLHTLVMDYVATHLANKTLKDNAVANITISQREKSFSSLKKRMSKTTNLHGIT